MAHLDPFIQTLGRVLDRRRHYFANDVLKELLQCGRLIVVRVSFDQQPLLLCVLHPLHWQTVRKGLKWDGVARKQHQQFKVNLGVLEHTGKLGQRYLVVVACVGERVGQQFRRVSQLRQSQVVLRIE